MAEALLQRDQALTVKQKEIEVERAKAESAQATVRILEEVEKKHAQMMKEKERCHQERVRQLTENMERERAQVVEEQERILNLKLQEQKRLIKEGLKEESLRLKNEIQLMEQRNREKEAESAEAAMKMLEDMYKMDQKKMAQKGESHQEHVKQLPEEKKESPECQAVMAPGTMKAPMCLVENKNKQLFVNPRAIHILNNISQPVVVVAIVGMYRTGKSYLMNCLAGQNNGFPLGCTV